MWSQILVLRRPTLTSILSLLILVASIGCTPHRSPEGTSPKEYDGQQIFKGLVLAQGPVAEEIPVMQEHFMLENYVQTAAQQKALTTFNEKVVSQIAEERPDYFASFRERITSGNRTEIKEALDDASVVAVEATARLESVRAFQERLQDPALADSILSTLSRYDVEDRTVEEAERILEITAAGELGEIPPEGIEGVGQGWLVAPHMHAGFAVVVPVEVAAAVCTWVEVTFDDDNGNGGKIPFPRFGNDRLQLLQEQAIDQVARRFG